MTRREEKLLCAVLITVIVLSCFRAAGCARADDWTPPTEARAVPVRALDEAAVAYWERRGVVLPEPVELFASWELGEHIVGRGAEPGNRVWLIPLLLTTKLAYARCLVFVHERGHNAGLSHEAPFPIMHDALAQRSSVCLTYALEHARIG